jgi:DNA mismatch repair ATPase MutS
MEYIVDQDDQIINLYKLKEGSVNTSCALPIAKSILLGPVACSRAEEVSTVRNTRTNRFSIIMGHKTEPAVTIHFPKIHVSARILSWQLSLIFLHSIPIHRKILYVFLV